MYAQNFINNELNGYKKTNLLEKLIKEIINNNSKYLEFETNPSKYCAFTYGVYVQIDFVKNNKVDGYLAHELLHAKLFKNGFPCPLEFFMDYNKNIKLLNLIGNQPNANLFNLLSHMIFFEDYIARGFVESEFVVNYNKHVISANQFSQFYNSYFKNKYSSNVRYINCYMGIKADQNTKHKNYNDNQKNILKNINKPLFDILEDFLGKVVKEKQYSKTGNIIKQFYEDADKLCIQ